MISNTETSLTPAFLENYTQLGRNGFSPPDEPVCLLNPAAAENRLH
jgi:hypothetical protein